MNYLLTRDDVRVATLGRRFMRKCVAPILIFSVPKGCSAVLSLSRI